MSTDGHESKKAVSDPATAALGRYFRTGTLSFCPAVIRVDWCSFVVELNLPH